jgi:dextranase
LKLKLVDFYPIKGMFKPGEVVKLQLKLQVDKPADAVIHLSFWELTNEVEVVSQEIKMESGNQAITFEWLPPEKVPCGYGVVCKLLNRYGKIISELNSAFDVLVDWINFPRYGFLTDFTDGRDDIQDTLEALVRFHINGLQFYDWQYRHDQLLPPTEDYIDPLGRKLSLQTVSKFIDEAHNYGMASMPYLAIYAASLKFWCDHPNWSIYDHSGQPLKFMDFLGLMDPSPGSPWFSHLLDQCKKVLTTLPFDGLHIDQYGDPKEGYNAKGEAVDIPAAFSAFINTLKSIYTDEAVVFNAVGNWPIEVLAPSSQDFSYIEVLPPKNSYLDLPEIVLGSRQLSSGKPVVIALYLPTDHPANIRLADALIFSCGGSRIEFGEHTRLLTDPYFPNHKPISLQLESILRKYYDFAVRYGVLLGPGADDLHNRNDWRVIAPLGIWNIIRKHKKWLAISLVNLNGLDEPNWDQAHPNPTVLKNIPVEVKLPVSVDQVYWVSPDDNDLQLRQLPCQYHGNTLKVTVPILEYWGIIVIEMDTEEKF